MSTGAPRVWIGTSWKMNKGLSEALDFADALMAPDAACDPRIQRFVMPPFTVARAVRSRLDDTSVRVGAQNMHWADAGAWTGEISAPMLTDCGLDMVEIGHSERRAHFAETDETVGLKAESAVRHGLTPLICVGESLEAREEGRASEVLATQVRAALDRLADAPRDAQILLAYEPVWAIGDGGVPASPHYADARLGEMADLAETVLGRRIPCLYGGSVTAQNCAELIACPNVDGLFIGRAAWDARGYLDILARCAAVL
ncbi:triose-phosphate isomerase [Sulfitobacter sp. LCG007]